MANVEIGSGKTVIILSIVAACFGVLWPKIFYPMFVSNLSKKADSNSMDGCCDVMFETDINAIKIMNDLCGSILNRQADFNPKLSQAFQQGKLSEEVINTCRSEVMKMCGIDIAEFLNKKEKIGHSYKQILDEIRSFNVSICLRHHFGVNPGLLGTPRRMRIWSPSTPRHLRQERPLRFRPEIIHPALTEKGRAIPQSHVVPKIPTEKEHAGPIHMPGKRPPMGGPGHVVPPPKTGGTISVIMPIYTIGIILFFTYTIGKIFLRKTGGDKEYKNFPSDPEFRRVVYSEDYSNGCAARIGKDDLRARGKQETCSKKKSPQDYSTRLGWKERDTRDIEIDHLRKRLEETEKAMERIVAQMETVPTELLSKTQITLRIMSAITGLLAEVDQQLNREGETQNQYSTELKSKKNLEESFTEEASVLKTTLGISEQVDTTKKDVKNGHISAYHDLPDEERIAKPKVKVMGLELMAECEDGQKWSRPATPNLGVGGNSRSTTPIPPSYSPEPQNIFLEGALPQQSQLLVTDSKTQKLTLPDGDEPESPVILSSKMTLSVISLDAALPEENIRHDQPLPQSQVDPRNECDDGLETADSTLLDIDSVRLQELIDETGQNVYEPSNKHEEPSEEVKIGLELDETAVDETSEENLTGNYTTATSDRARAGLESELEDTAVDISNLDGFDIQEDHEDLQNETIQICSDNTEELDESQEQPLFKSKDSQQEG